MCKQSAANTLGRRKFPDVSDSIANRFGIIMSTPSTKQTKEIRSTAEIRSKFPALERIHNGHSVAYFDAPGGTQTPQVVVDAVSDYLLNHNANTHWEYPSSHETDAIIESSRHVFADFLNAEANEIAFGPNTTT